MSAETRNRIAADYVAAFERDGSRAYVENLETEVYLHQWGEHALPTTVNDGGRANTFVCSPEVGYIDYTRDELSRFPNRAVVPALRAIVSGVGGVLRLSDVNRIVHINNWMTSTNHPVDLDLSLTGSQTSSLAEKYPTHLLAIRSLTRRYCAGLMDSLVAAGWVLLPSRQVFLVDDITREIVMRRDSKRDEKLWQRGAFGYEELSAISANDAARIVELYNMLYLEKYSRLNPAYTARFVSMTRAIGMMRYLVLRDGEGVIQGFGAMYQSGRYATMPLIGYNTRMDQDLGLYRLTFHAGSRFAAERNLLFNMSSGATAYKRTRGATAEMEFTAFYLRHLPASRRLPFEALRLVANHVGMPLLRRYDL